MTHRQTHLLTYHIIYDSGVVKNNAAKGMVTRGLDVRQSSTLNGAPRLKIHSERYNLGMSWPARDWESIFAALTQNVT